MDHLFFSRLEKAESPLLQVYKIFTTVFSRPACIKIVLSLMQRNRRKKGAHLEHTYKLKSYLHWREKCGLLTTTPVVSAIPFFSHAGGLQKWKTSQIFSCSGEGKVIWSFFFNFLGSNLEEKLLWKT